MGRPRKPRRDPEIPARTEQELEQIRALANKWYFEDGGRSLDLQSAALDHIADAFDSQMNAGKPGAPEAHGPNITTYEARMAAGRSAALHRLRKDMMAQRMLWAEEAFEAKRERNAPFPDTPAREVAETQTAPDAVAPSTPAGEPVAVVGGSVETSIDEAPAPAIHATPAPAPMNRAQRRAARQQEARARRNAHKASRMGTPNSCLA